jgi:D-alanine-D-alanine ligase
MRPPKRLRVLLLVHEQGVPPESLAGLSEREVQAVKTEFDVASAVRELGHDVQVLGVLDELRPIRRAVEGWQPHIVFNLLMEFQDVVEYQAHVASYLELLKVPYTGCNPRGLLLARDKALAKKIFVYHRIPTPAFAVLPRGREPRAPAKMRFPLIVKSLKEEASLGIAQASIVANADELRERARFVHERIGTDAIAEEYIRGRELTISVMGNERVRTLPVWELSFENLPESSEPIATARVKWDLEYQKRVGVRTGPARALPTRVSEQIARLARRVYKCLALSGFARLDLRLDADERMHVIEANAFPDLAADEDLALSAKAANLAYPELIQRILNLGLRYRAPWWNA